MSSWYVSQGNELSASTLYDILRLRALVFVVEQNCAFQDADGQDLDENIWHLYKYENHTLVAYCRLIPETKTEFVQIGRVVTDPAHRNGMGTQLMTEAVQRSDDLFPGRPLRLFGLVELERFYGKFGFSRSSDVYVKDLRDHITMERPAN